MTALLLNIDVPDVNAAAAFYTSAFGLTVGRRFGTDAVELLGWLVPCYLLGKNAGTIAAGDDVRRYDRHWTPLHADVVVDDLDVALARAVAAGATIEQPARDAPYGRIAMVADPFGHGFCLIAFNATGYDGLLSPGTSTPGEGCSSELHRIAPEARGSEIPAVGEGRGLP